MQAVVQSMTASQLCDTCLQLKEDALTHLSDEQRRNRIAAKAAKPNEEAMVCALSSNYMQMWPGQLPCGNAWHRRQTSCSIATHTSFLTCDLALQAVMHDLNLKTGVLLRGNDELEGQITAAIKERNRQQVTAVSWTFASAKHMEGCMHKKIGFCCRLCITKRGQEEKC